MTDDERDQREPHSKPSVGQIIFSTLAAAFGVQSNKNRERDFTGGNIYIYMAAGVIFTTVFVVLMVLLVRFILRSAGAL
ncbi:DUF2970 domain-containing protein [Marinimicrobium alkaliphilum]|uniref:DUF2970 domain-containing protein n=1 Tax=Marinimicrobium alkaliphilum TaxID=2202654 RepID=UPI001E3950C2|nr:DUF2970 domain-containing protein [Marinimicrobium alkaliphilum]